MAYDRYDTRDGSRDDRSRWSDDRNSDRWRSEDRRGSQDRGFFERAGDEIASWFGDDDAERRRRQDAQLEGHGGRDRSFGDNNRNYDRGYGRDYDRDRSAGPGRYDDWNDNRGAFARGGSGERDYDPSWRREFSGRSERSGRRDQVDRWVEENNRDFGRHSGERARSFGGRDQDRSYNRDQFSGGDYRPMTGDYGRSQSEWDRDPYRDTSRAGTANKSDRSRLEDPHYRNWRDRHLSELDRDYDDYRAENQSRFESDFGSWRERRQQKRGLLGQIREHMEVVGDDEKHVGTVDKVAGDRLILTKSDPESGGAHHSISCSDIGRVEGDRVYLDCSADEARNRWRDETRNRALFEREDQGEMGPRVLDRSFEGTYR